MAILINDTAPRAQYTATSGQTVFTVSFEFFANSDLKVYRNATLLTLTTNYTVTGAGVTGGGSVTLVTGATAGDIVTIIRDVPVARTSDFPTSGPFNIEALNTDLDRLTAMVQQQETLDGRSLRLDQFDTPNTLNVLPVKASRVGRVLQFNDTTGQPEAGPTTSEIANAQTNATNAASSATAAAGSASAASVSAGNASTSATNAASSASAASTSASNASSSASAASTSASNASTSASAAAASETAAAGSASTASTQASNAASSASAASTSASNAATSASNASTSASNASSSASAASASQIAAAASAAAAAASYDSFDDRYLGSKTSDPTLDNDGNALVTGALYYNSVSAGMKVYDGANWIAASSASAASLLTYRYIATAGQTTFSGLDANSSTMSYAAGNIIVTQNGVALDAADYTATNGTSVVLNAGATLNDVINVVAFKSFTVSAIDAGNITTGILTVARGGTGSGSLTANNVLLGNGTSAVQAVAPGTTGNVLTSNGTTWQSTAPTLAVINAQTFNSSTNWTKPAGYSANSRVYIQAWGAGGSGSRVNATNSSLGNGGGGGGYNERWCNLSDMGATETITIGAGGAATTVAGNGNTGGNSSVGSLITAYGGGGANASSNVKGGGGGQLSAGGPGTNGNPQFGAGGCDVQGASPGVPAWISGGGGGTNAGVGASSVWGGGGGGGGFGTVATNIGGTSSFAGNGGAGSSASGVAGVAGTAPGGAGGAGNNANSGAGAAGRIIITVFPA